MPGLILCLSLSLSLVVAAIAAAVAFPAALVLFAGRLFP